MRMSSLNWLKATAVAVTLVMSAGYASADSVQYSGADGTVINSQLSIGGSSYSVDWYLPSTPATALVTVQHGFSRNCGRLRDTTKRIMARGLMALCVNADMSGGNPTLAAALGNLIASRALVAPGGVAVPAKTIVSGHSAGGHFATEVGKRLALVGYPDFKGAVLFDPVGADGFEANLVAISNYGVRPVLAVTSRGGVCNKQNNAHGPLRNISNTARSNGRDGFVGLQLLNNSTHVDSEGNNTNSVGYLACFQSAPKAANTGYLRDLSSVWASDMANGTRNAAYYPGGTYVEPLLTGGQASKIN